MGIHAVHCSAWALLGCAVEMDEAKRVCVTGANGFIASYVVKQLLEKGYHVHGTVRDSKNRNKVAHLEQLEGAGERLTLFDAALLGPNSQDSFRAAFEGCSAVIHTASPYKINVADPMNDLILPAREGVSNVFQAAKQCGVGKIVLTSSVAAVTDSPVNGHVYTEEDWNTASTEDRNPYYYSKTVAEKRGWELASELGIELVVI